MELVEKCFIETRQIFMNNSESSVLKCKVCSERSPEFQVFPVCTWNGPRGLQGLALLREKLSVTRFPCSCPQGQGAPGAPWIQGGDLHMWLLMYCICHLMKTHTLLTEGV